MLKHTNKAKGNLDFDELLQAITDDFTEACAEHGNAFRRQIETGADHLASTAVAFGLNLGDRSVLAGLVMAGAFLEYIMQQAIQRAMASGMPPELLQDINDPAGTIEEQLLFAAWRAHEKANAGREKAIVGHDKTYDENQF